MQLIVAPARSMYHDSLLKQDPSRVPKLWSAGRQAPLLAKITPQEWIMEGREENDEEIDELMQMEVVTDDPGF